MSPSPEEPYCTPGPQLEDPGQIPFSASPLNGQLPGTSRLFSDYLAGRAGATSLFPHDPWEAASFRKAARHTLAFRRNRLTLVEILTEQNERWGEDDATREQISRLTDEGSVAVVTGQQLGLFAGPLYTIHKALTAVRLAERLEHELERPVVPIFWLADEDHDFAEIRSATFNQGADVRTVVYDDGRPPEVNRGPVGRIELDDEVIAGVLDDLERSIPPGPFRNEAVAMARAAYAPGRTMRDAFALLLRDFTAKSGLVIFSADDSRIKASAAPILKKELEAWSDTQASLVSQTERVERAGYRAQVDPSPLNLFVFEDGERRSLRPAPPGQGSAEGEILVQGGRRRLSRREALDWLGKAPEDFSPNVVLRPVVQDALLPTVAYVAGPGETAYFAQLHGVYERFGVPMPVIVPRMSLTLVDPGSEKVLERYDLALQDVRDDLPALHRRLALDGEGPDLAPAFSSAQESIETALESLRGVVVGTDVSLERALEAGKARIEGALSRLEEKTVRVHKRQHQDILDRLSRASGALWPNGKLQERVLSPLQLLARYGTGVFRQLVAMPPLDTSRHWIVTEDRGSRS